MSFASYSLPNNFHDHAMATHGSDQNLFVEFHTKAVENTFLSEKEGRPVYENVDFISIHTPGDRNKKVVRKVAKTQDEANGNAPDTVRFRVQWEAYQQNKAQVSNGTPLEMWPPIDPATIENLKVFRIFTVEQLASTAESNFDNLPLGIRAWRDKAKSWLASAEGNSELIRLNSENNNLKTELAMLKKQLEKLASDVESERRSPGRPRSVNKDSEQ